MKTPATKQKLTAELQGAFLAPAESTPEGALGEKERQLTGDTYFGRPYVDTDEQRTDPVRHRYVHGGFTGTETRFSFYFLPAEVYKGRFFQHVTPVPQSENLAQTAAGEEDKITLAALNGAYFVETNGGGPQAADPLSGMDPTIGAYRANAVTAEFSRVIANELYGEHRPYGYLYGGSGAAFRTIGAAENTENIWDGYVPYVVGSPMAIPNVFSVRMHAQRVLRNVLGQIADAYDVGGRPESLKLTAEEQEAFEEVTRMGFPPRSWFEWRTMGMHAFRVLYPGMIAADPTYPDDFWTLPGYLGAEPHSSVHRDHIRHRTVIQQLVTENFEVNDHVAGGVDESYRQLGQVTAGPTGVVLRTAPDGWVLGAELQVRTGVAAGQVLRVAAVEGAVVIFEPNQPSNVLSGLRAGDEVVVDNSNFLAAQTYHRHQVPGLEYSAWDQFRTPEGAPRFPQRQLLLGPVFTAKTAGTVPTGRLDAKMIAVACLLDREAFPWQADWYRSKVKEQAGSDPDNCFRLWYIDNATHGDDQSQPYPARTVPYLGALHTALRQLARWVEDSVPPADSTTYSIAAGQVHVPDSALKRHGVQPTVTVLANGSPAPTIRVGEPVCIEITAETPPGVHR